MRIPKNKLLDFSFILIFLLACGTTRAEGLNVSFLFVGNTDGQAYLGAEQGLKEANLQGRFLGQNYSLTSIKTTDISNEIVKNHIAILVDGDSDTIRNIAKQHPDVPVMNLTSDDDELRADCIQNALHIIPSQLMMADALNQWLQKTPDSKAKAQAWHPDFKKFAARDLNKRFKKTHDVKMLDDGWAGWAAVKMMSDAVARNNITESGKMLTYLQTDLIFDGQKGINMNFRTTGQLRQPILIIEEDKILAEAPVRGVANPPTLESLGLTDCPK